MTRYIIGLQATLVVLEGALHWQEFEGVDPIIKGVLAVACAMALAFVGPLVPKVSGTARRLLDLQRRGND